CGLDEPLGAEPDLSHVPKLGAARVAPAGLHPAIRIEDDDVRRRDALDESNVHACEGAPGTVLEIAHAEASILPGDHPARKEHPTRVRRSGEDEIDERIDIAQHGVVV